MMRSLIMYKGRIISGFVLGNSPKKKPCRRLIYFRNILNARYLSPSPLGEGFRVRPVIRGLQPHYAS
jgi:hypothetical protein